MTIVITKKNILNEAPGSKRCSSILLDSMRAFKSNATKQNQMNLFVYTEEERKIKNYKKREYTKKYSYATLPI